MKKALLVLWLLAGCAPVPELTPSPTVSLSPSPTRSSPPPSATPLQPPLLPDAASQGLNPLPGLTPEMRDSEPWWANSGIGDNRLAYFSSDKPSNQLEPQLLSAFQEPGYSNFLEGIPAVFSFEGNRICVLRKADSDLCRMFVLAPLNKPEWPASLKALKLPPVSGPSLKGPKTLVVLASGERLGEHVDHMLGQAGLVIEPTSTPSPAATPAPSATP